MLRYLAFVWNSACATASADVIRMGASLASTGDDWTCSLSADGLRVYQTGEDPVAREVQGLSDGQGIIVGRFFKRRSPAPNVRFEELIDDMWGRYVAFETNPAAHSTRVIRSPSGALNCFYARCSNVYLFFSDVADYTPLRREPACVNWRWMATLLAYPRHAMGSTATGIIGIDQVQPGECVICEPSGAIHRKLLWNPFRIASSDSIEDFTSAVAAIRHAAQTSIWSWASCYPRIIHLLSGGLDSSIVLHCLRSAPSRPHVTCVTYFDRTCVTGDERIYARVSAESAHCRLLEVENSSADTDMTALARLASNPVPWSYLSYLRHSSSQGRIADETASTAIFSGTAGDQVFFYGPVMLAAADHLRRYGIGRKFVEYAAKIARRNKFSLWSVISTALQDRLEVPRYDPVRDGEAPNKLITREAVEEADDSGEIRHYWMPYTEGVAHGKLWHVLVTDCLQDLRDPLGGPGYPERVQPLNSQPLIETCLRVPTYVLTHEGWSRAAARTAFAGELPPGIVSRVSKGYIDSQHADLLLRNLALVREWLLDGELASRGFIDRRKLETILTPEGVRLSPLAGEILCEHLSYEAWLQTWQATRAS
jgi:asparagine synthase (glutamine-hydrolysing)